ncbi:2-keto-4-pentenoate hydratase/2-oxohepta-3-ene-1,7-dioic acid hydratase in catechol pathway [Vreelandella songnenensis]|uniref:2-keto-4-pentenoate hydratase/2-oxohepta-3-ene-1,7-dioic acid hydratase in catechol pathway n=1 Tax=Vreelandella songnenensis TaxID=1176243 RepID=A0A2T0V9V3_9GAMM|nr:fumarylacetoacetate hydrolase family protein [Halomonas songnenensis]PRY66897.1 2-keto-4-pentenoate hydratase/2-oxohepta-3-ene-1,7-dioic acid hydratase in catechol pathway [Halomonas songnenensis]
MRLVPQFTDGQAFSHALGKVVCVGRNYADHAKELDNPVPSEPLLFIKPATSVVDIAAPLTPPFSRGDVHYEAELALLVGETLTHATPDEAERAIVGIGLALDLTLRDVQTQLKEKGHPWEIAKGFDGSCPLSQFLPLSRVPNWNALAFTLEIDGEERQRGEGSDMIFAIPSLVAEMSRHFTLEPGDVILTGTPAGVGELTRGMALRLTLTGGLEISTSVAE